MPDFQTLKKETEDKFSKTVDNLKKEFMGLRTGRASANLLEPVLVDAYGSKTPITQLANINVPESRLLTVNVWDKSLVSTVEKAIRDADLGLNPATEGQVIRIPIPTLNEERRKELSKIASNYAEQARISVRNSRREAMDELKKMEKNKEISEDELKSYEEEIQKITNQYIQEVDEHLKKKEEDIMAV
jgi:ribosome recycling factor